jgi:hypothetical protein
MCQYLRFRAMPVWYTFGTAVAVGTHPDVDVTSICSINETTSKALHAIRELHVIRALYAQSAVALLLVHIDVANLSRPSFASAKFRVLLHDFLCGNNDCQHSRVLGNFPIEN